MSGSAQRGGSPAGRARRGSRATEVAGDSGNDARMFQIPDIRGIVVANARPELLRCVRDLPVYYAQGPHITGVIEGLLHYGVLEAATL